MNYPKTRCRKSLLTHPPKENISNDILKVRYLADTDALETIVSVHDAPPRLSRECQLLKKRRLEASRSGSTDQWRSDAADLNGASSPSSDAQEAPLPELDAAELEETSGRGGISGTEVFGFQRGQRRQHLQRLAEEIKSQPPASSTADKARRTNHATDRSRSVRRSRSPQTPTTTRSARKHTNRAHQAPTSSMKTPQVVRRRIQRRLSQLKQEDIAVSDDDSDYSPLEDESESDDVVSEDAAAGRSDGESDEEAAEQPDAVQPSSARSTAARRRGAAVEEAVDGTATSQQYFELHQSAGVTSNHTLSALAAPRLSRDALQTLLSGRVGDHATQRAELAADAERQFPHWLTVLRHGYSVLLHGLGSKRALLERLRARHLHRWPQLVVCGYHPALTPRQLLQTLVEEVLQVSGAPSAADRQLELVLRRYSGAGGQRLFLLVHSMDGPLMRTERMQQLVGRLAQAERIHLIASVDHINAPLVWDQHRLAQFNFLWFDVTSLAAYTEETSYESSLMVRPTAELALSSLRHVFKSLTPNGRGVLLLLAKHQVDQADARGHYDGLPLSELYRRCREAFLVSSQVALHAQLTELRDHRLVRSRQSHDGAELLAVPLANHLIAEFLTTCDEASSS